MKKILFVDTGREYGGGTKSFLYLLRGLAVQQKYELCAFFETDYEAGGRKISQIIEEVGAKFIKFEHKKQPSKLTKELLRALGGQILAKYLYKRDYDYALCLLRQVRPDILHLNNHFSTNLAYIAAANDLNIAVVQHLRKNSPIEPFKLEILKRLKFTPVCVSNATYEFYAAQIKMPKNVVYNPVEAPVLKREKSETGENSDALIGDKNFGSTFNAAICDRACGEILGSASDGLTVSSKNGDFDNGAACDTDKIYVKFERLEACGERQIRSDLHEIGEICGEENTDGELKFKPRIHGNENERNLCVKAEEKAKFDAQNLHTQDRADQMLSKINLTARNGVRNASNKELGDKNLGLSQANLSIGRDKSVNKNTKALNEPQNGQNNSKNKNESPQDECDFRKRGELKGAQNTENKELEGDKNAALKAKFDAEKINIVMPANFLTLKGHELVFDALAGLKRSDIKVYFAGGGELKAGAKAKFDALIKSGKAEYLGFVSKMDEIYAACDYVLGFSSDEGLPRVVIEALGCGLGVVYSDIAVIREIYEISSKKQDFFIVQRSSDALLACFDGLRKSASKSPDEAAIKAFSIENYLRGIDRIYSEL